MPDRDKSSLSQAEIQEYTSTMKELRGAESQYGLSQDQLKGSLLAIAIVFDIKPEQVAQDYQLLTDQQVMESKSANEGTLIVYFNLDPDISAVEFIKEFYPELQEDTTLLASIDALFSAVNASRRAPELRSSISLAHRRKHDGATAYPEFKLVANAITTKIDPVTGDFSMDVEAQGYKTIEAIESFANSTAIVANIIKSWLNS